MVVRRYMRSSSARITKAGGVNKGAPLLFSGQSPFAGALALCSQRPQQRRTRSLPSLKTPVPPQQVDHPNFEGVVGHHPGHQRDPQSANAGVAYQNPAVCIPASHGRAGLELSELGPTLLCLGRREQLQAPSDCQLSPCGTQALKYEQQQVHDDPASREAGYEDRGDQAAMPGEERRDVKLG